MDGPKAFPGPSYTLSGLPNGHDMGMTLRDYFAGQAIVGIVAKLSDGDKEISVDYAAIFAREAYAVADAMLKAREGGASCA